MDEEDGEQTYVEEAATEFEPSANDVLWSQLAATVATVNPTHVNVSTHQFYKGLIDHTIVMSVEPNKKSGVFKQGDKEVLHVFPTSAFLQFGSVGSYRATPDEETEDENRSNDSGANKFDDPEPKKLEYKFAATFFPTPEFVNETSMGSLQLLIQKMVAVGVMIAAKQMFTDFPNPFNLSDTDRPDVMAALRMESNTTFKVAFVNEREFRLRSYQSAIRYNNASKPPKGLLPGEKKALEVEFSAKYGEKFELLRQAFLGFVRTDNAVITFRTLMEQAPVTKSNVRALEVLLKNFMTNGQSYVTGWDSCSFCQRLQVVNGNVNVLPVTTDFLETTRSKFYLALVKLKYEGFKFAGVGAVAGISMVRDIRCLQLVGPTVYTPTVMLPPPTPLRQFTAEIQQQLVWESESINPSNQLALTVGPEEPLAIAAPPEPEPVVEKVIEKKRKQTRVEEEDELAPPTQPPAKKPRR
jgi:hypothetical protein